MSRAVNRQLKKFSSKKSKNPLAKNRVDTDVHQLNEAVSALVQMAIDLT